MKPHLAIVKRQAGFSLMELAAVITVIAILASLALPSIQGRIVRKQIEAAMVLADVAQKPIAASWLASQTFPVDNAAAGLPEADKIVNNFASAVTVQDGAINIKFGNRAHGSIAGKILTLRPAVIPDAPVVPITWVCANAEAPDKMTVKGNDQTNLPATYLPLNCRKLKP